MLQVVSITALMLLLRRGAAQADDVLGRIRREETRTAAGQARREEELRQNDVLHGTVLATLTTVATGALGASTRRLREQAAIAVRELTELASTATAAPAELRTPVRLDQRLRLLARSADVDVRTDLVPVVATEGLVRTVLSATSEALANVARHAGVPTATLRLTGTDHAFEVEIADCGRGFDPERVPSQRYGVRGSIRQAMIRAGGEGTIESVPGRGSRVVLRWPHPPGCPG
jgi:signal transduction histidine kinase